MSTAVDSHLPIASHAASARRPVHDLAIAPYELGAFLRQRELAKVDKPRLELPWSGPAWRYAHRGDELTIWQRPAFFMPRFAARFEVVPTQTGTRLVRRPQGVLFNDALTLISIVVAAGATVATFAELGAWSLRAAFFSGFAMPIIALVVFAALCALAGRNLDRTVDTLLAR